MNRCARAINPPRDAAGWLAAAVLVVAIALTGCDHAQPPSAADRRSDAPSSNPPRFTDLTGAAADPLSVAQGQAAVLIFITTDCPIANSYCPEINRIHDDYAGKGVKLTLVHVDPDVDEQAARAHADEYALRPTIVIDRRHELVRKSGAQVTPEAVVFDAAGRRVYRGRINDQNAGFGDRRAQPSQHDLRDALDAVLAGQPLAIASTKAIGCYIPDLPAD